MIRLYFCRN